MENLLSILSRMRRIEKTREGDTYALRLLDILRAETRSARVALVGMRTKTSDVLYVGEAEPACPPALEVEAEDATVVFQRQIPFDRDSGAVAEILARETLLLVEHAAMRHEGARRARHLALLDRVTRAGGEAITPAEVVGRAAPELCEAFDGDHIALHVVVGEHLEVVARQHHDGTPRVDEAPDWFRRLPLDGSSLPARAVRERRTFACPFDDLPERARIALAGAGVAQLIFAPLLVADSAIGTLSVAQRHPRWDDEQLRLLEAVTTRLAAELLQARLLADERKRAHDLTLINEIGSIMAQQLDLAGVVKVTVHEVARLIDVPRVTLGLVDDERKFLESVASTQADLVTIRVPVDAPGTVSLVYRTQRPVVIDDAETDERAHREIAKRTGMRSVLVVPLVANGQSIGTILLAETRRHRRFTNEEVARAVAVANLAAPAIVNAKMFTDLRRSYEALSRAQAELVRHERLAALGELSAVIAHEVRNPLAVIFNSLGSLRKLAAPTDDAKILLDIVGEEASRLNRIVADLLDFVRPYSSHPRPTNLENLVIGALDGARRSLPIQNVTIDADIPQTSRELLLDATMVQQALVNLISNAVQATPPGGRVTVRARTVEALETRTEEAGLTSRVDLCFEVTDEGPGIDPADVARIFQPFFTTKPTGTGLGLAIVRRIADALGGRIEAASGMRRGTVFTLTVPTHEPR
jgi:signal transduction histidine kinase